MTSTKKRGLFVAAMAIAAALLLPGTTPRDANAQDGVTLRIATLAPRGSSWHRVFSAWNNTLRQRTNNQVSLRIYAGGSQGDERDYIRKIRINQLDGAAVTSIGLGLINRQVLVLQAPGVFRNYRTLDAVRDAMRPSFNQMFASNGFSLLSWGDVGEARVFSTHEIHTPQDLRARRPWMPRDESGLNQFLEAAGARGVRLGVPEVLGGLSSGQVDTVIASATAAAALQWHTRTQYVSAEPIGILSGATVMSEARLAQLTPEQRTAVEETAEEMGRALRQRIRRDDRRYYTTLTTRHGMNPVTITDAQEREWNQVGQRARAAASGRIYPAALLRRVEACARSNGRSGCN